MARLQNLLNIGIFCFYCISEVFGGNGRFFVFESCGSVIGPDFGAYLEFHQDSRQNSDGSIEIPHVAKGKMFNCVIVIRGMPSTGEKRYMSVYWRNFHLRSLNLTTIEHNPAKCGKAYVTVYNGKDKNAADRHTFCGAGAIPSHLEWEGEYATLEFHIDFTSPNTNDPSFPYPEVYFRLDITSFDYDCSTSIEGKVLKCNHSRRCIDDSLRCDYWFSRNCQSVTFPRDNTDTSRHPPANCFKKKVTTTTTTTPAPPPPSVSLTPLYVILGLAAAITVLTWCCWRPGYIPWRLARMRNAPCFNVCSGKCIPCCVHTSPCCAFLGEYPCCRCCAEGYGSSPTGGLAWLETKRMEALFLEEENGSCASGISAEDGDKSEKSKEKSMKEQLLACVGGKSKESKKKKSTTLSKKTNSVRPLERTQKEDNASGTANLMTTEGNGDRNTKRMKQLNGASIGNSASSVKDAKHKIASGRTGSTGNYDQLDEEEDGQTESIFGGNKWLELLSSDGMHLREHRL